ncbi:MAG: calcium/sodium antiporter [Cyclobacteriaceae bacterium]
MEVAINVVLIVVGFVLLIKGADFLVSGASSLAKRFNISDIAIGLTVVAMGTSAPELVVNIISGSSGHNEVVYGNIIGSNIFNMFLILGLAAVIYPITVQKNALWKEVPYSLLATIVFFVLVNDVMFLDSAQNELSLTDSFILLVMFGLFLLYIFLNMKNTGEVEGVEDIVIYGNLKTSIMVLAGIGGLSVGGKVIVDNAVELAHMFNVSEKLIGLTILAAGTSLPELATTAVAAFQKKSDLAVGNIVGSNIFNLLLVLGLTGLTSAPLVYDAVLNVDVILIMIGTLMMFVFMFTLDKYKIDRVEGAIYLVGFVGYTFYLFTRM